MIIWLIGAALALGTLLYMGKVDTPRRFAILLSLCVATALVMWLSFAFFNTAPAEAQEECETSGNSALAGLDMVKCAGQRARRP